MEIVRKLTAWSDDRGNRIEVPEGFDFPRDVDIRFVGSNNVLTVGRRRHLETLRVRFDCDNGTCVVGGGNRAISLIIRVGQDSTVKIGRDTSATEVVGMSAVEGTKLIVGKDVMFASRVQVRTDDGHPIFDVRTGKRVNTARDVRIGNHVWLGWGTSILGGARIGDGSVVGINSVVTSRVPNNAVAVGSPARVVRTDIAWERPHLSLEEPFYKPDASTVARTEEYWNLTENWPPTAAESPSLVQRALGRLRRSTDTRGRGA